MLVGQRVCSIATTQRVSTLDKKAQRVFKLLTVPAIKTWSKRISDDQLYETHTMVVPGIHATWVSRCVSLLKPHLIPDFTKYKLKLQSYPYASQLSHMTCWVHKALLRFCLEGHCIMLASKVTHSQRLVREHTMHLDIKTHLPKSPRVFITHPHKQAHLPWTHLESVHTDVLSPRVTNIPIWSYNINTCSETHLESMAQCMAYILARWPRRVFLVRRLTRLILGMSCATSDSVVSATAIRASYEEEDNHTQELASAVNNHSGSPLLCQHKTKESYWMLYTQWIQSQYLTLLPLPPPPPKLYSLGALHKAHHSINYNKCGQSWCFWQMVGTGCALIRVAVHPEHTMLHTNYSSNTSESEHINWRVTPTCYQGTS